MELLLITVITVFVVIADDSQHELWSLMLANILHD